MTPQELAARLNGRELGSEITKAEEAEAKAAGLVVLFGASDDLVELRGAIDDELGAYEGTTLRITPLGLLPSWETVLEAGTEGDAEDYFRMKASGIAEVKALWCPDGALLGASWAYETAIPHATFDVMEDGELYCRGIVFRLADVAPPATPGTFGPAIDLLRNWLEDCDNNVKDASHPNRDELLADAASYRAAIAHLETATA